LNPLKSQIPPEVFTTEFNPPSTDGSGNARDNLAKASALLDEAGWKVENGKRVKDGKVFQFEIIDDDPGGERTILPFAQNLQKLGIDATVRVVDSSQYQSRIENFDFDMTVKAWGVSPSPGNEQREYWGTHAADTPGSENLIGIANPAVDKLIEQIVQAPTRHDLIVRCTALDRVLQWNYYLVPMFNIAAFRVAYWNKFGIPEKRPDPLYSYGSTSWWIDPEKEAALASWKQANQSAATTPATNAPEATPAPAPAATTPPADTQSTAAPQTEPAAPAERGRSPFIYVGAAIVAVIVAFALGRRRKKSS
jgi:microcin C transport system substrate-binding protein